MTSTKEKFYLLMWKHWVKTKCQWLGRSFELLVTVLFCGLVILAKPKPQYEKGKNYTAFEVVSDYCKLTQQERKVIYSPKNEFLQEAIQASCHLNPKNIEGFNDSSQLKKAINGKESIGAAVIFKDELRVIKGSNDLPTNNIEVTMRFQVPKSKLQLGSFQPGNETGYSSEDLFLPFQDAISSHLIHNGQRNASGLQIVLQQFPKPDHSTNDSLPAALELFAAIIIIFCFLLRYDAQVKEIVIEKELKLKESMKILGLPSWLILLSWVTYSLLLHLVHITAMTFLLTRGIKGYVLLPHCNWVIFFLFLLVAACSNVAFTYLASSLCSTTSQVSVVSSLVFLIGMIPFLLMSKENNTLGSLIGVCLLFPTATGFGVYVFENFDQIGEGVQWYNIWDTASSTEFLCLGVILLLLIADTFLYLILGLYLETVFPGDFGIPQPWYFPFQKSYWFPKPSEEVESNEGTASIYKGNIEAVPSNLPVGIKIENLTKKFRDHVVVRNFSLEMYEGQITVLLGHNGAGKSTTLNMITGMISPTSGTIRIHNYDVRKNLSKVRESMGLCLQHNVLFDDLNVWDHLYFVCNLRHLKQEAIDAEIKKYVKLMGLEGKEKSRPPSLSGGMQRKLCIAMALCGEPKVVMLDEPTASLDPSARREIWNLLLEQKQGRTILLVTHYMDEADLLGDRIAIMSAGELQCCGSGFFLKKKYGTDYHLILEVTPGCQPNTITNILRSFIPTVKFHSHSGSELTYKIPENESRKFAQMLGHLENNMASLNVISYGITPVSLEEVFLKTGYEATRQVEDEQTVRFDKNIPYLTGVPLVMNHVLAMVLKRSLCMLRSWIILLISQLLLPVAIFLMLFLAASNSSSGDENGKLDAHRVDLDSYHKPITLLESDGENPYAKSYEKVVGEHQLEKVGNVLEEIAKKSYSRFRKHYVAAAAFHGDSVTAWFNGENEEYPYSAPLALALVYNAYIKVKLGDKYSLNFVNHPIPVLSDEAMEEKKTSQSPAGAWTVGIIMAIGYYILFYARENVSKAKHLQLISGVNTFIFWIVPLILDLLLYHVTICVLVVLTKIFQPKEFSTTEQLNLLVLVLSCFGFFIIPFMYLTSFLFKIPVKGYGFILCLTFIFGMMLPVIVNLFVLIFTKNPDQNSSNKPRLFYHFVPFYAFTNGVNYLLGVDGKKDWCIEQEYETVLKSTCELQELCCALYNCKQENNECHGLKEACKMYKMCQELFENNHLALDKDHIGLGILVSFCLGLFCFLVLLLKDCGAFRFLQVAFKKKPNKVSPIEQDVQLEDDKIMNTPREDLKELYILLFRDLTKYYGKTLVVNGICLGVKSDECFGLVGANGAGKTTIFKMITNDISISYGEILIAGLSVEKERRTAVKLIGYCPQYEALLEELTPRETLRIFALIRGVPLRRCKDLGESLAKEFDFYKYIDRKIKELSGGNKRKLSISLALLGDPKLLCLDEPTSGIDPSSKRLVWNALIRIRESGKPIILSSHDMEECDALCTRACVMVKGNMKCIGSVQRLKSKFAHGFNLILKIRKSGNMDRDKEAIDQFIKSNFPKAILKETYQDMVTYQIPDSTISYSRIFGTIEGNRDRLGIEDYSLGQGTLEQVFLSFMEKESEAAE